MSAASKRNRQPEAIDIRRVRQIVITFDEQHLPADIVVEMKNGQEVHVESIEETNLTDVHRSDWKSYTGLLGEPNLMVEVSIGGAR
jgi:hypothetical protein